MKNLSVLKIDFPAIMNPNFNESIARWKLLRGLTV